MYVCIYIYVGFVFRKTIILDPKCIFYVLALENRHQVDELVLGRIQNEAEQLRMKNSTLAGSGRRSGWKTVNDQTNPAISRKIDYQFLLFCSIFWGFTLW